jgi:hypothetical protein
MHAPIRTAGHWLAGRLFLLLVILALLVVGDVYRDESSMLVEQVKALWPDATRVERLEAAHATLQKTKAARASAVAERLAQARTESSATVGQRIAELDRSIKEKSASRRSGAQRAFALLTGEGVERDIETELEIQLLTAERSALQRLRGSLSAGLVPREKAEAQFERARLRIIRDYRQYERARDAVTRYERSHPLFVQMPLTSEWLEVRVLRAERDAALDRAAVATREYRAAKAQLEASREREKADAALVASLADRALRPLEEALVTGRAALRSAELQWDRVRQSASRMFLAALVILAGVTLAPVAIRAFLYYVVAPAASRRPPIRLGSSAPVTLDAIAAGEGWTSLRPRISAVSQEIVVAEGDELLVQPDFLQSSSDRTRKSTKWLLDWRYPFTSLAAGMVVLTRVRSASPEPVVVSSKTDPFSEVGVIALAPGTAFTLQPRNLVGVLQRLDTPVQIRSRWRILSLSAWITLQFRYLVFQGPGTLVVQGCRGVRTEPASRGRSIDQAATIGFSAELEYSCRRSETFGAYALGMRSLFNDNFAGGPGVYVYEEMPFFGKKTGMTGRGLEGLVDAVLRCFGI